MRDLCSIKRGSVVDKGGREIPVARVSILPANKYSPRYVESARKMAEKEQAEKLSAAQAGADVVSIKGRQ